MGKEDKLSRSGKIFAHSFGKTRSSGRGKAAGSCEGKEQSGND